MKCKECNGKGFVPIGTPAIPVDRICPACKGRGVK